MGEKTIHIEALYGKWVHSREEDTQEEMVFRPPGYTFPPSRGRAAFKLGPNNSYVSAGIGSTDISDVREGRWELENAEDLKISVAVGNEHDALTVTSVDKNRLTIRKKTAL
jgi:hypothetical protein